MDQMKKMSGKERDKKQLYRVKKTKSLLYMKKKKEIIE